MRLTAIVPATNAPDTLDRCLAALRGADEPPEELIVVSEPAGAGPAQARNLGAARAAGEVLLFVDADVVVHRDAIARLRRRLADERVAAVFGSYDDRPPAPGLVSRFRNLLHHHVHQQSGGPVESFWAGLGAVRRDPFHAVGGFDALRYARPSIEDVELGTRLTAAGYAIELDPAILGTHLKRWTLTSMLQTDALARGAPWVELALHRRALPAELNLGWRHRLGAGAAVAAATALARGHPRAAVAALGALAALNASFYRLLAHRLGIVAAASGVTLHALHHLSALAAVPLGALRWARSRHRG